MVRYDTSFMHLVRRLSSPARTIIAPGFGTVVTHIKSLRLYIIKGEIKMAVMFHKYTVYHCFLLETHGCYE